ncbi:MAG: DEAD/DEAH box helicase [Planctomycetota bacterium]
MIREPERRGEDLERRLEAYVRHEAESGRKSLVESWALTVAERVEAGDCLAGLRLVPGTELGRVARFRCSDFSAKFREGEPLYLGQGDSPDGGLAVSFEGYDLARGEVGVSADSFEGADLGELRSSAEYCLDRRGLGLERLLLEGLESAFHPKNRHCVEALLGNAGSATDQERYRAALEHAGKAGFLEQQGRALALAVSGDGVTLIQGPPGTGKTRVLAEAALMLARARCRIFLTAFTHRAVDNALLAMRALSEDLPLFKLGRNTGNGELAQAGILLFKTLERLSLPDGGAIVGGTPYAVRKFNERRRFHFVFIDEAGQMPVAHGAIAMTQARRYVVAGDPRQLPPVKQGDKEARVLASSIFEHLEEHYGSLMLDRSFRLNTELARFVSEEFYGSGLRSDESAAGRRLALREGGRLRAVLDPRKPLVLARVDHQGRTRRSREEATLVADLVEALLGQHRLAPEDLAVITPFRAQVRLLRHELDRRKLYGPALVVDTVERMQGQEREVVILSLVSSDRDYLESQAAFYYETGRLNVSLSRARTKCIVVASREAFRARPRGLPELLATAHFKRLPRGIPVVDLTREYVGDLDTSL